MNRVSGEIFKKKAKTKTKLRSDILRWQQQILNLSDRIYLNHIGMII